MSFLINTNLLNFLFLRHMFALQKLLGSGRAWVILQRVFRRQLVIQVAYGCWLVNQFLLSRFWTVFIKELLLKFLQLLMLRHALLSVQAQHLLCKCLCGSIWLILDNKSRFLGHCLETLMRFLFPRKFLMVPSTHLGQLPSHICLINVI